MLARLVGAPDRLYVIRLTEHSWSIYYLDKSGPAYWFLNASCVEMTGATIGAMREALKRLETEGTITLIPQRGVMVREPGEIELNNVYEARKVIEVHAARIFAETGDLRRISEIKELTLYNIERKAETRAETAQLLKDRIRVDDLLHETLIGHLNNQTLEEFTNKLLIQIQVNRLGVQPRFMDSRPALR